MTAPSTKTRLAGWIETGLGFLFPPVCQICRKEAATAQEGYVCRHCYADVRFVVPPFCRHCGLPFQGEITIDFECGNCRTVEWHFESARAAVVTTHVIRETIHKYKYNRALWFEEFLADLLIRQAKPVLDPSDWDWIVPVPLFPVKKREREFNQAERLGKRLSLATGIPMRSNILKRIEPTQSQTALSRAERAANVSKAFAIRPKTALSGERIVLVDDVFTTGATTNACCKLLKINGSGKICVWTVARGL